MVNLSGEAASGASQPTGSASGTSNTNAAAACACLTRAGDRNDVEVVDLTFVSQRVFAALPDKEELEYSMPSDDPSQPYQAATRSRFDTPEFYAANADILRRMKLF